MNKKEQDNFLARFAQIMDEKLDARLGPLRDEMAANKEEFRQKLEQQHQENKEAMQAMNDEWT